MTAPFVGSGFGEPCGFEFESAKLLQVLYVGKLHSTSQQHQYLRFPTATHTCGKEEISKEKI